MVITDRNVQKKGRATSDPAYRDAEDEEEWIYFFKNLRLPYLARPIRPDPRRSRVAGSGTDVGVWLVQ